MVISFLFLIVVVNFICCGNAISFSFSSPNEINIGEKFVVKINADTNENYDVKIFVNDKDKNILSEIENNGWKNPFYYLKSVFPGKKEYENRIINGSGENNLCVRLRKSGANNYGEICKKIQIKNNDITPIVKNDKSSNVKINEDNKIMLNADVVKENTINEFATKKNKLRLWLACSFIIFCITILILLIARKI
jgi:hypothetical protein